jgi:hypothetical protein
MPDPETELNPVQFETRSPEHCRWEGLPRMVPLGRETELRFPNWTRFKSRYRDDRVTVAGFARETEGQLQLKGNTYEYGSKCNTPPPCPRKKCD